MNKTTVALAELTLVEIDFYEHEVYAAGKLIASIGHDDDLTQPWLVLINGVEVFRHDTFKRCHSYITWHYQRGTLPVQEQETPVATTGNEVIAEIATECEKYNFDLMDDGIYHHNDVKLGKVGCTDGRWWVMRASSEHQQKVPCDSVMDAVWSLSMVQLSCCEHLLDRPFETLTVEEWLRLVEYQPGSDSRELITA
jgi:hypothetical protein